jgi:hypothetical protein
VRATRPGDATVDPATKGASARLSRPRRPEPDAGSKVAFSLIRRGRWPAFAAFREAGPHTLEITTLDGVCVLRASGTGPGAYSLADLAPRTVYSLSGSTPSGEFSRRLLVP